MNKRIYCTVVFIIFILSNVTINAQDLNFHGNKFVHYYSPEEYEEAAQIWSIAQDKNGVMYFGADKLITFDGTKWKKYKVKNTNTVRTVTIDNNGRIYVGGSQEFGYFEPNNLGKLQYSSLTHLINDSINFQTIWRIVTTTDKTYFISAHYLFIYDGQNIDIINNKKTTFQAQFGFKIDKKVYISIFPQGISTWQNNQLVPILDTSKFKGIGGFISFMKFSDDEIMLLTTAEGIFIYDKNSDTLQNFNIDKDVYNFISKNTTYQAVKVNDTSYAAGTLRGGIIIFDNKGHLVNTYNVNKGLKTNSIYTLFTDNNGNLWAGTENGIIKIDITSPITFFNKNQNFTTYPTVACKYNKKIYLGGLNALYYFENYNLSINDNHLLKKISNIKSAWDLIIFNNRLLACGEGGVNLITDTTAKLVKYDAGNMLCFGTSPKFPKYIFIGKSDGVNYSRFDTTTNKFSDSHDIDNFSYNVRQIQSDKYGNLWICTRSNGAAYMHFYNDNVNDYKLTFFNQIDSIKISNTRAFLFHDNIYLLSDKGIYKAIYPPENKPDTLIKFIHDTLWTNKLPYDTANVSALMQINDSIFFIKGDKTGFINIYSGSSVDTFPISKLQSIADISRIGHYLFLSQHDAAYIYDLTKTKNYKQKYYSRISKVTIGNDSVIFNGYYYTYSNDSIKQWSIEQPDAFKPKLNYKNNSITFEFSAIYFEATDKTEYSYYLKGYEDNWRPYSPENKAVYTNLNEGEYTFLVKAKNVFGTESEICSYQFKIHPPWYRTWWAYTLSIIILALIFYFGIKYYTRRLKRTNIKLEKIVTERTKQITEQNNVLTIQKEELQQQKEEILTQAEELEKINKELEKLSIVAEKTDNAVLIFDDKLNLIWVNIAHEKIYGKNAFNDEKINILKNSTNTEIKTIVDEMLTSKKSVSYKSIVILSNKTKRYVQTSLTPIFGLNKKLSKVIAIESDITEIEQANQLIHEKNHVIESSLNYAETIQKSILPNIDLIKKYFEFDLIYRPKDIVSGDFYWFTELKNSNPNFEYENMMIVADCTGHGVPGAFMSLIAGRLLEETITYQNITNPAEILNIVSEKVIKVLQQDTTNNTDGFDIAICKISKLKDSNDADITFAGAKMPIYYFNSANNDVIKVKGDLLRIGLSGIKSSIKEFSNNNFTINTNDTLYMMSDGYIDQNNYERKKLGSTNLKKYIAKISVSSVNEQVKFLSSQLDNWQEKEYQRDDITICVLKIK